ncbi:MAG TPA: hypothetical protein PK263_00235 [bacterium]|nr:hypothetical protein [bacterium]
MDIKELLATGEEIWGKDEKMTLREVIACMGKVYGDICRYERNAAKDVNTHNDHELKKELGHLIFSTIRWSKKVGFEPETCIKQAIKTQEKSHLVLKEGEK